MNKKRNAGLDLIKWLAIITMVIDHLRLINIFAEYNNILVTIGRFAFPFFAFVLAVNFNRIIANENYRALKPYILNLGIFSIISEIPYRLLEQSPTTINVMPTLLLGMVFMILIESKIKFKYLILAILSTALIFLSHWLMYGFLGVILPMACLFALKIEGKFLVILPMFIAAICNAQYLLNAVTLIPFLFYSIITCAALAILFSFILMNLKIKRNILPVGHWGYWFYPIHLFLFSLINFVF